MAASKPASGAKDRVAVSLNRKHLRSEANLMEAGSLWIGPDFLGREIGLIEMSGETRIMTDNFEKDVAVDGRVVNEGKRDRRIAYRIGVERGFPFSCGDATDRGSARK